MYTFSSVTTFFILVFAIRCSAFEHRCVYDDLMQKFGSNIPTVRVVPTSAQDKSTAYITADGFAPIRIKVFSEDLNDPTRYCTAAGQTRPTYNGNNAVCGSNDVFTPEKKSSLLNVQIPNAIDLHAERLMVVPLDGNAVLSRNTVRFTFCQYFTIPSDHFTTGATGADMFLYVAAGPVTSGAVAWAGTCAFIGTERRPGFGGMNFAPRYISNSRTTIRTAAHEIAHALGFNYQSFSSKKLVTVISSLRGKTNISVVNSAKTLEKAREHYGCSTAPGMELEDEGGSGTALSHWERRNAKDEMMSGISGIGYYTALTMAVFEDLGYYRANWGKEEAMEWGNGAGCDLLTQKCIINGVTSFPDMFCTTQGSSAPGMQCSSDRSGLGRCSLAQYTSALPSEYQYFTDPTIGGRTADLTDFCPFISPYSNARCMNGEVSVMPGSVIGPASRCMEGSSLVYRGRSVGDVCALVSCENNTVSIRYSGDTDWHVCPSGGSVTPSSDSGFSSGRIVCPKWEYVCTERSLPDESSSKDKSFVEYGTSLFVIIAMLLALFLLAF